MDQLAPALEIPVTVLVPVHNGLGALRALVASLAAAHPTPGPDLTFLFIDDASTDERVAGLLAEHRFFARPDVEVCWSSVNRGFVRTVNHGLTMADPRSDVLLLNSDVEIHGQAIGLLQAASRRHSGAASLTPLTNNGSIASLFAWPEGSPGSFGFSPQELTALVEAEACRTSTHGAPTGVGFCLYLSRTALDAVGLFDADRFGRGYGEENDWCQRAAARGFVHLICTETFVFHRGTQSFRGEEKEALIRQHLHRLEELHPGYAVRVQEYLRADPLRGARERLLWRLGRRRKERDGLATVLMVLHNDPLYPAGGTEAHVRHLTAELLERRDREVIHLFPDRRGGGWRLRLNQPGVPAAFEGMYSEQRLAGLLGRLLDETSVLHVHHLAGASLHLQGLIRRARCRRKVFTAHDYWALCPSVTLVGERGCFCELPDDAEACNRCLAGRHGWREPIQAYRQRTRALLASFDQVLVPSVAAREVFRRGLGVLGDTEDAASIGARLEVCPNPLPFARDLARLRDEPLPPLTRQVVFLGGLSEHKGADLSCRSARALCARGYQVEHWGMLAAGWTWPLGEPRPYRTWEELHARAHRGRPFAVCLPFLWPETFSFVTYEALVLLRAPLVVGPFGHPARLVKDHGVGVVMREPSRRGLLDAFRELERRHAEVDACLQQRWPALLDGLDPLRARHGIDAAYGTLAPVAGQDAGWDALSPDALPVPAPTRPPGLLDRLSLRAHDWICAWPGGSRLWERTMRLTARLALRL